MTGKCNADEARAELRGWVLSTAPGLAEDKLTDTTPLLEARLITSLHVPELLLLIERLRGRPIDLSALSAGDLKDLATICARFLE